MAKSVFFSFHYERDNWRVQQVINMGVLEGQSILKPQEWEEVKRKGEQAIKNWIAEKMKGKSAVVVLIGNQTANREWVRYEIRHAWDNYYPLVGIRIHGLKDSNGNTDTAGQNPFERVNLASGAGTLASRVPLYTPSGSTSQQVHADISANLTEWVNSASGRSRS